MALAQPEVLKRLYIYCEGDEIRKAKTVENHFNLTADDLLERVNQRFKKGLFADPPSGVDRYIKCLLKEMKCRTTGNDDIAGRSSVTRGSEDIFKEESSL